MAERGLVVDSFAGGGGASDGIRRALGRSPDIAINHDPEAIAMHAVNHPETRHYTESVWKVDPIEVCHGQPVELLWLSPDCTHHSKARGGKPRKKKIRGLAWLAVRWAAEVRPSVIILENVEEFQTWGPLLPNGIPCPDRKGETFRAFVRKLESLGYAVEWRELRACDYGSPTIRRRLFLVARCDGRPITWPRPTHGRAPGLRAWRTAAECIDWSLPCPSIFLTKKEARIVGVRRPLAEATLRRIARGLKRFVLDNPEPFIVPVSHGGDTRVHSINDPLRTITAGSGPAHALVAPVLVHNTTGNAPSSPTQPLKTIATGGHHFAVAAFLAKHFGGFYDGAGASLSDPAPTVTAKDHNAVVAAHLTKLKGTSRHGQQISLPLHTVQAGGEHYALTTSHLVSMKGRDVGHPAGEPIRTITSVERFAEVRAFLFKYYGTEQAPRLEQPLHTITSKDRFGLVTVHGVEYAIVDIGMRMLTPRELYRAQGFHDSYLIDIPVNGKPLTKRAQVRMVGNSVPPDVVEAICRANLSDVKSEARVA